MATNSNQNAIVIDDFLGLYVRRNSTRIPRGYLKQCLNLIPTNGSLSHRDMFNNYQTVAAWAKPWLRGYMIDIDDKTAFVLFNDGAGGNSLGYINASGVGSVIIALIGLIAVDFSFAKWLTRYYITLRNSSSGFAPEYYVFDPTVMSVARKALGVAPTSSITVTVAGGAGTKNISAGIHVWGVAYGTNSGHITAIALTSLISATHAGQMADLSTIPLGPAGTTKRYILVSKVIPNFDGNLLNYEVFFLPNGTINDNTTTVLNNVEFYDSELSDSADYLKDLLTVLPAISGMCSFNERLIAWDGATSTIQVSQKGKPESFDSTTGVITVDPGYGSGIQYCIDYRGSLIVIKSFGAYHVSDNGGEPNTWEVTKITGNYGTTFNGVSRGYGSVVAAVDDNLLILTSCGLMKFNGSFDPVPLTFNIDSLYRDYACISEYYRNFRKWQVYTDPICRLIYITFTTSVLDTYPRYCFVGDYSHGLTGQDIRWSTIRYDTKFSFGEPATTIPSYVNFNSIGILPATDTSLIGGNLVVISNDVEATTKGFFRFDSTVAFNDQYWIMETGGLEHGEELDKDQNVYIKILNEMRDSKLLMKLSITGELDNATRIITVSSSAENVFEVGVSLPGRAFRPTVTLTSATFTSIPSIFGYPIIKRIILFGQPREGKQPK